MNFEIWPISPASTQLAHFFRAELEAKSLFSPKVSVAFQFCKVKLLPQFLVEPMYILDKTIP